MKTTSTVLRIVAGGLLALTGCADSAPQVTKPENPVPLPDPSNRIQANGDEGGTSNSVRVDTRP